MDTKPDLLDVTPFQETLYGSYCGPASLKMVLAYFGIEKTEEEVAKLCKRDPNLGVDDVDIKRAAEAYGMQVEIKNNQSFEDVEYWLAKKVPVIVDWFTRGRSDYQDSDVPDGHYSVVVGLDQSHIYLQDPEIGKLRVLDRDDFYHVWFDFTGEYITDWSEMVIRQVIAIYPRA